MTENNRPVQPRAEIQYVVSDASHHEHDVEVILDSIGVYQETIPFNIQNETLIEGVEGAVSIRLQKVIANLGNYARVLEEAQRMRQEVESHFPEEDRERLLGHFAGIAALGDDLERD